MEHLLYYMRRTEIDESLIYKKAAVQQMIFIRDSICGRLLNGCIPFLVSSHMSKSVTLPVYGFTMHNGIKVICRNNFHDWKISIELPRVIGKADAIPTDLISCPGKNISDCYCEGFRKEWVYGAYKPDDINLKKFTIEVSNDYKFWTIMYLLNHLFEPLEFGKDLPMSKEQVVEVLKKVYQEQGNSDIKEKYFTAPGELDIKPYMNGWELLTRTYLHFDNKVKYITDETRHVHKEPDFGFDTCNDPEKFADFIVSDSEGYKVFESEVYEYNQVF